MKFQNLLSFETKKYLKICFWYSVVWISLIFLFIGFFDSIKQSADQITQLYANFPKELLDVFGKGMDTMTSIYGYFGVQIMTYLLLSGCIFTVVITSGALAGEINNRNMLFLLSKPISRLQIYSAKLSAIALSLLASNVLLFLSTILAIKLLTKEENLDLNFFILIYLAMFILQLFFAGFTAVLGVKLTNGRVTAIGSLFVIMSYLLNILSGLSEKAKGLRYLSPNFYLDLSAISIDRTLKPESLIIIVLSLILVVAGAYFFKKRDIN